MKLTLVPIFLLTTQFYFAQNTSKVYFQQFDNITNSYASDLNNGKRYEDLYLTIFENDFRFFMANQSTIGYVNYNEQDFFEASLKYDLLEDDLLFKNGRESNHYDVILDKSMVSSFSIYGRNFVKLPIEASNFSFYKNGFFELTTRTNAFDLYVKHEKLKRQKLGDNKIYYTYIKKETLLVKYKSIYYEINFKNDIIKILPEKKEAIKSFYKNYSKLESENKIEFMKQLFTVLTNEELKQPTN